MKLIDFYGEECPHCHRMMPLVDKIALEEGLSVDKFEVWHNKTNAENMRLYRPEILQACGGAFGVPVLVEPESRRVLCGEVSYDMLRHWVEELKKSAAA